MGGFGQCSYSVAAGADDIVFAPGVEKLQDTGYGGLLLKSKVYYKNSL